ncbi:enoyl-CoA hydratase/isomerase family protein [Agrobacterium sp. NPDC089420]|uniref:enoyl-CoA hydratase/isomerase family protein n=1 Tax=Agrobacterium sp. NPDC089420 TaxID=3363918 RepID=UPI00385009E7
MDRMIEEPEVLVSRSGSLGHISLNRPKALNSLTLNMVRTINAALDAFEENPDVIVVLLTGEGHRGLCAGGDIRMLYDSGKAGTPLAETFWREEYVLNSRIGCFPKPYVAIMDGLVMGGGVGISAHGSHRIVTDKTRLAMPETGIGFFPDVGGTWLLSRPNREWGTYLGLTGTQVGAADAMAAGLADFHLLHEKLDELADRLCTLPAGSSAFRVKETIAALATTPEPGATEEVRAIVETAFRSSSVEEIIGSLETMTEDFAQATCKMLLSKSPTSLEVTLRLLRLGASDKRLEECLKREFAATQAVLKSADFYEGVRAAVIDKDRKPQWTPRSLAEVEPSVVSNYFVPHPRPIFAEENLP